jgi:uncharacterized repeat protein (TIGR03847 family)
MNPPINDFGIPDFLEPDAIGNPGNRRFRIIAQKDGRTACLWIEREQLTELVTSIQQFLARLTGSDVLRTENETPPPTEPRATFTNYPDVEFQVGPMALGYDEESARILFLASPLEAIEEEGVVMMDPNAEPLFRALLSVADVEQFIKHAEALFAAGRPRCPLCGQPLNAPDEPHGCVKLNGHRHLDAE